ncbi:LytR C-terminal domain-containing protein, partial [Nocardiopsis sp. L17-MgMaSL7]|uniref:LytR C-terminal domain-containing protein n=1 Tax=Nocardiopsis sp. L17-MgMaSL7 TaxID=1938893 RepID=UPI000D93DBE2
FVTVPNGAHPADENRIIMSDAAPALFEAINNGVDLGGGEDEDKDEEKSEDVSVEPGDVAVEVVNNTGIEGLALEIQAVLVQDGFVVTGVGNPEVRAPELTTVYHGPGDEAAAKLLADSLTNAQTEEAEGLEQTLELVAGSDWEGFGGSSSESDLSITDDLGGVTAEKQESAC